MLWLLSDRVCRYCEMQVWDCLASLWSILYTVCWTLCSVSATHLPSFFTSWNKNLHCQHFCFVWCRLVFVIFITAVRGCKTTLCISFDSQGNVWKTSEHSLKNITGYFMYRDSENVFFSGTIKGFKLLKQSQMGTLLFGRTAIRRHEKFWSGFICKRNCIMF